MHEADILITHIELKLWNMQSGGETRMQVYETKHIQKSVKNSECLSSNSGFSDQEEAFMCLVLNNREDDR